MKTKLLDCTLRDGAYITDGYFGEKSIKGIIKHLQDANIEMIECGWLKNTVYSEGSTYYNTPNDFKRYLPDSKKEGTTYVAMIDYNRYDLSHLPLCDGESIDAIRVVFPQEKVDDGLKLVKPIREKGYKAYLQAANTYGYSDTELIELANKINNYDVEGVSIVDTFGAMYDHDLERIVILLHRHLRRDIKLGFHSHNNKQLSFALSIRFIDMMIKYWDRDCIVDASLCGMGRGAGNAPTELLIDYMNDRLHSGYDTNAILDAVDMYMYRYMRDYSWGYSIPYMLSGKYACHVNNVAYLTQTHRTRAKDMKTIFENMSGEKRKTYDYDYVEDIYHGVINRQVDDSCARQELIKSMKGRELVLILPGKSAEDRKSDVLDYISKTEACIVIGINSLLKGYPYDYLFFSNEVKYQLVKDIYSKELSELKVIVTSNISSDQEIVVNYDDLTERKWKYYDNSLILFLELMRFLSPKRIDIVGFDGYKNRDNNYADKRLEPPINESELAHMQNDIEEMFREFALINKGKITIKFLTESPFEKILGGTNA